jgi:hypothetical protein
MPMMAPVASLPPFWVDVVASAWTDTDGDSDNGNDSGILQLLAFCPHKYHGFLQIFHDIYIKA